MCLRFLDATNTLVGQWTRIDVFENFWDVSLDVRNHAFVIFAAVQRFQMEPRRVHKVLVGVLVVLFHLGFVAL